MTHVFALYKKYLWKEVKFRSKSRRGGVEKETRQPDKSRDAENRGDMLYKRQEVPKRNQYLKEN